MLSKSSNLRSLSQWRARFCLNRCTQDCSIHRIGVSTLLHNAFCAVAEPLEVKDSNTVDELPSLSRLFRSSGKKKVATNPDNDDFVPPSVFYWIKKHNTRVQDVDMKGVANDIVESDVDKISKVLKSNRFESPDLVVKALDGLDVVDLSESLVEQVLRRFSCDWIPAFGFFKWAKLQNGVPHSPDLYNLMVDNLGKMKKFEIMWGLVEELKQFEGHVTLDTMNKIIRRLAKAGKYEDAIETFKKIDLFGVEKDVRSLNRLLDTLVKEGRMEHAERVYSDFKEDIPLTTQTFNILINGWCKNKQIDKAKETLDEMKKHGTCPDLVTYTSFIEAYCHEKDFGKVDDTLEEMQKNGFSAGIVTYTIMLKAYARAREIDKAMEVYEQMKQNNCHPDPTCYNVFIKALRRAGRVKDSDAVFEDMSKQGVSRDAWTYKTLIFLAANNLEDEKALNLLMEMEEKGYKPDRETYASLLGMCLKLKRMKVMSFLLSHMFENDVSPELGIYTLLVVRLGKSGRLDLACEFFEECVLKGFVPEDGIYENLIKQLEEKGMIEEKQRVEAAMAQARQSRLGHSDKKVSCY